MSSNENLELTFEKGAKAVADADVLLVVTGAGYSADSGLAVYNDVAKVEAYQLRKLEYNDLCQPKCLDKEPGLFYGFWGQCFNDYRGTRPHHGYEILAKWRNDKINNEVSEAIKSKVRHKATIRRSFEEAETVKLTPYAVKDVAAGSFYTFTSNADAHFYDFFPAQEIHDCHGNVELWQCSDRECKSGIWRAPINYSFYVDRVTMLAPEMVSGEVSANSSLYQNDDKEADNGNSTARIGKTKGQGDRSHRLRHMPPGVDQEGWAPMDDGSNWPRCGHCRALARPAIFMFGDFGWKYDVAQNTRWELWREALLELVETTWKSTDNYPIKVCILEMGCGLRVQTCRNVSETLLEDVVKRGGEATLIRVNPDSPEVADERLELQENTISYACKGLQALEKMDAIYERIMDKRRMVINVTDGNGASVDKGNGNG